MESAVGPAVCRPVSIGASVFIAAGTMDHLVNRGLQAKRESKYIDFKESFDPTSAGAWCEIIKAIVAMANTGGGVILFGLDNSGTPTGFDVAPILTLDSATVTDRINKYTGYQFTEFEILDCTKAGQRVAALHISEVAIPLVFQRPGTYDVGGGKQKTAVSKGTVYYRHGAKSEPGTTDDLRKVIERQLESIRRQWIQGVRKVVQAPAGAEITVLSQEVMESTSPGATPIRIVTDPKAPPYRLIDPDVSHPHRQKELIEETNNKLPDSVTINTYDVLTVRRVHKIDDREEFCHVPKYGSPQYSDAFVSWLVEQYAEDIDFFSKARKGYYAHDY